MVEEKMLRTVIAIVALLSGTIFVQGADQCSALLQGGVFDKSDTYSFLQKVESIRFYLCRDSIKTIEDAKSGGGNATIPIEGILVDFGLKVDSSNFQSAKEKFCTASSQDLLVHSEFIGHYSRVNQGLVEAFVKCINGTNGLHANLETTQNREQFTLRFTYRSDAAPFTDNSVRYTVRPASVNCDRLRLPVGPAGSIVSCSRNKDQSVLVTYNSERGSGQLELPRFVKDPAPVKEVEASFDYAARWDPSRPLPDWSDPDHNPHPIGRGEVATQPICLQAEPGWLLKRSTVSVTPLSSTANCYAVCPEDDPAKTPVTKAPLSAASCKGENLEERVCFILRMAMNSPGEHCEAPAPPTGKHWLVRGSETKLETKEFVDRLVSKAKAAARP
jgi:hypothetical protein